jgi:prepilin-type processing-associated H-X9-DG protein
MTLRPFLIFAGLSITAATWATAQDQEATAAAPAGVAVAASGSAQSPEMFITGAGFPARLKLLELSPAYHAFRLKISGQSGAGGGLMSMMMMGMATSNGGGNQGNMIGQLMASNSLNDLYFSTGKVVPFYAHDFLACYRLATGISATSLSGGSPKFVASLHLALVRTDEILSIDPEPSMTPESLRKTLTDAHVGFDEDALQAENDGESANQSISMAILLPVFAQAKIAAEKTASISNGKQVALSMLMYANDFDDQFPDASSTAKAQKVTYPYAKSSAIWKTANPAHTRFLYNTSLAGVNMVEIPKPSEVPLIYESGPWADGTRIVAYADGHVKRVSAQMWSHDVEPWLHHHWKRARKKKN